MNRTVVADQGARAPAPLLEIDGLETHFFTDAGVVRAVDRVSCRIREGETLAVVGESGCGKSVTALSILRLVRSPPGRIVGGAVRFRGRNLLELSAREIQSVRGNEISMIFQEPMSSLNPVLTVGAQVSETLMLHQGLTRSQAMKRSVEFLELVHIPEPATRVNDYPHQLSGGMRQRVMIAMALSCNPQLLIADEPTTALDVTIQAQILALMQELQQRLGTAVLLITHDMGVVAENADRVVVMYAGRKVEEADVETLFAEPRHPYTAGLLHSIPVRARAAGPRRTTGRPRRHLNEISGIVPSLLDLPAGCAFQPRCPLATRRCEQDRPELESVGPGHWTACWNHASVPVQGA
ncbi:MAG: ABC transporter ATP-binding protein [Alphaproteobacteria bacterium]|nr:ABC transporter ATP-binding protein [Alphaproteobacteria bacterium]